MKAYSRRSKSENVRDEMMNGKGNEVLCAVNLDGRATWDFDLNQKSEKLTIIINRQQFFSFSQVISNNF